MTTALKHSAWILFIGLIASSSLQAQSIKKRVKIEKKIHSLNRNTQSDDSEEYNSERAALLQKKRQGLIQDIKGIIKETRNESQRVELNLRLASLYSEDYRADMGRAQKTLDEEMQKYKANPKAFKKMPELSTAEANASMDKARAIYKDLYARYPKHPRRDEITYFLGMSSMDRGNAEEGMRSFTELINNYPHSKYMSEALLQVADNHFDNNRFEQALNFYNLMLREKQSPLKIYVHYKKAWCMYNLQKPAEAIALFKYVIANEDTETAGVPIRVRNEAIRDIALPFVDLKRVDESIQFYSNLGDKAYRSGLEAVAGLYLEKGDFKNAISLYTKLLELDQNYAKNAEYETRIIEALRSQELKTEAIAHLFEKLPLYAKGSTWYEINSNDPQTIQQGLTQFEEIARKYALEFHAEAQKTNNEKLYDTSKDLYTKYLEFFPNTSQSPQIRFYLAEILYREKKYSDAADQYYLVFKNNATPGPLKKESISNAIKALDIQMNAERKEQGLAALSAASKEKIKDPTDKALEVTAYSAIENKFFEIGGDYISTYPKEKDTPQVLYLTSYLYYIHFDFPKAYKGFWQVLQQYPDQQNAYPSAYLVLDILNRKKDYPKLILACQKFLTARYFTKVEFKAEVAEVLRKAELKRIALIEESGEFKLAAKNYVDYTKNYGKEDESLYEKALYNATVNYSKAGLMVEALEVQEQFLRRFQKSEMRRDLLLGVAKTHESLAHYDKSAEYFDLFSTQYPTHEQSQNALRLAGLYYWGSGNQKKAEDTMLKYAELYPKDSALIEKDLMDLYEAQGATDSQIKYYITRRSKRGIPISLYVSDTIKMAELVAGKSTRLSEQYMEEAQKVGFRSQNELMNTPRGVESLAKILFWNANQKEAYFSRISLQAKNKQLEINLQKKLALLKELEKDYAKVASLQGGEWGLGSIFKTANTYHRMAMEVLQAPIPTDLKGAEVDEYRKGIETQIVTPFKEKALGLVSQCMDKTEEFNVISSWTARCYNLGSLLDSKRFPNVRTFYLPPVQVSLKLPEEKKSIVKVGNFKKYVYPFHSVAMFRQTTPERMLASQTKPLPSLYSNIDRGESQNVMPLPLTFRILSEEREQIIKQAMKAEPQGERSVSTFNYLNLMRQVSPDKALGLIRESISQDPTNPSLHNLMALTYLDLGNIPTAKVIWLSLMARGYQSSYIWNNLGVVSIYEGHEDAAIEYFQEATKQDPSKEAYANLGFLALKHRNSFEAAKNFNKALGIEKDDLTALSGLAVAKTQGRDFDAARASLIEINRKFKTDPYGKISLVYLLVDGLKQPTLAKQILGEYVETRAIASEDTQFRNAAKDLGQSMASNRNEEVDAEEPDEDAPRKKISEDGEIPEIE